MSERLIYAFDKPRPDEIWQVTLTQLELLDRLVRFISPPRRHLHRYHGVFTPGILPCARRASLRLLKFVPDEFVRRKPLCAHE